MKVYIVFETQDSGHEEVWRVTEDEAEAVKYAKDMNLVLGTERYVVDEWDTSPHRIVPIRRDIARSILKGPGEG